MSKLNITIEDVIADIRKDYEESRTGLGSYFDWVDDCLSNPPTPEQIKEYEEKERKQFEELEKKFYEQRQTIPSTAEQ